MKFWMLTITGRKKYWGNDRYGNDPVSNYEYDNFVQNHKSLDVNDLVLIRQGDYLTGISVIEEVLRKRGVKELNECPSCGTGRVRFRKTMAPAWKCENGHHFNKPVKTIRPVTSYTASFERDYSELLPRIRWQELQNFFINKSALSIRRLSIDQLLKSSDVAFALLQQSIHNLIEKQPNFNPNDQAITRNVESAKSALNKLEDFLDGCKFQDDTRPINDNKLMLPIDQQEFKELVAEIKIIRTQLNSPALILESSNEPSFMMERVRDFLTEYIKGAAKTAGALTAAGVAAKLLGLLDVVMLALRTIIP